MGQAEYLKRLLAPLRVYALETGFGAAELEVLGEALDKAEAAGELLERELSPATAENWGLDRWEALLPYRPAAESAADRRAAILALLAIRRDAYTPAALSAAVSGCGLQAQVQEGADKKTVQVSFPGVRGIPENIAALKTRIEAILPCHLEIEYLYSFLLWAQLESYFSSWAALEETGMDWETLEKYTEAV